jgi:hypothetical protein
VALCPRAHNSVEGPDKRHDARDVPGEQGGSRTRNAGNGERAPTALGIAVDGLYVVVVCWVLVAPVPGVVVVA